MLLLVIVSVLSISCFVNVVRYHVPTYITENGLAWKADNVTDAVNDVTRQSYLHDHIQAVGEAIAAGCNVKGYFVWSFQVIVVYYGSLSCSTLYVNSSFLMVLL